MILVTCDPLRQFFLHRLAILAILAAGLGLGVEVAEAAPGVSIALKLPPNNLTKIETRAPEIGFSNSAEPRGLFDSNYLKRSITFNYEDYSDLLVFNQSIGRFGGFSVPIAAEPNALRDRMIEINTRRVFQESVKGSQMRRVQQGGGGLLEFDIPIRTPRAIKSIIGEGGAGLKVNGYYKISFAGRSQWQDGEQVAAGQSKFPSLQMEQISNFNISGTIGSKIFVDVNQDSKRQETFANRIQLRYKGEEDDVIKTIELGNTNLSLPSTRFIGYSQRIQGLFGIKTTAELGGLRLTTIMSQEKSSNKSAEFKAGAEASNRVIRDWNYIDNQYFYLSRLDTLGLTFADLLPGDSITKWEVYQSFSSYQDSKIPKKTASVYVDPDNPNKYREEFTGGTFILYGADRQISDQTQYILVHPTEHYILFDQPVRDIAIGIYMEYRRRLGNGQDTIISVGDLGSSDNDTLITLKLLKHNNPQPHFVSWKYVWRNVYDVGRVDNPDDFYVHVYRGNAIDATQREESDLDNQQGVSYINLLGIDNNNDGQVDGYNQQILDRARGHLRFPNRRPFDSDVLSERVPEAYDAAPNNTDRTNKSKYYLLVTSKTRQKTFSLGHFDIVPESESVTLNGRTLAKNVDYQITYESGQITFLNDEALSAAADVKIDYEYAPLISSEKKTLLGARAEYDVMQNFKIGATALYKSEKETDRKPKLGEEQATFVNLDVDASYTFETETPTKLINLLPFIDSKASSRVMIAGEVGQSMPNPNIKGEASIDDFEGSKERYGLGVVRVGWGPATVPAQIDTNFASQGKLIWYNPYDQIPITEVYDRDVRAGENRTNILVMRFLPQAYGDREKSASFAGIMRPLAKSAYNQEKTRFIEVRMRGEVGMLHIDIGEISEDLNGNGLPDAEVTDKEYVNEAEDKGLDKLSDAEECALCAAGTAPAWYNCPPAGGNCVDPAGDNWAYSSSDRDNYERINGTEGNRGDLSRLNRPDTEDLNADGRVITDNSNAYFSYAIDLANNPYRVEGTTNNYGWYTVRIPFQDTSLVDVTVGNASKANIQSVRLWLDGVAQDTAFVEIADIELTRNSWEAQPLLPLDRERLDDTRFEVSVVNTEEDEVYFSPPGVEGFYDKTTGLREREQSLRFDFVNFAPGDTGFAEKIPFKSQDLSGYKKLEMWIHGDQNRDNMLFFFRFGPDERNYYEYKTVFKEGWDRDAAVNIPFDEITQVKLKLLDLKQEFPDTNEYSDGKYRIFGNPSITRIKYYALGVTSTDSLAAPERLTGNVWIDELRATEVRRDQGVAAYLSGSMSFGDVASVAANYTKTDEFFRTLTQADRRDLGSGSQNVAFGYSFSFNVDKFFPPAENVQIPFSFNWSRTELSPRLITGSDILVPAERLESEKSVNTNYGFTISERWNKRTGNPLYTVLLNKFQGSLSYTKLTSRTPTVPVSDNERYTAKGRYSTGIGIKGGIGIFSWLRGFPLVPKRVVATRFAPLPNRLAFDGEVNRTTENRTNNFGVQTNRYTRTLRGNFDTGANPITGVEVGYRFSTDRDISNPDYVKFSFNPKDIILGQERRYSEALTINYSPNVLPFITGTKLGFTSSHDESFDQSSSATTISDLRRINNSRSFSAGATLNLQRLLGQNKGGTPQRGRVTPPKPKPSGLDSLRRGAAADTTQGKPPVVSEPKVPGTPVYMFPLRFVRLFTDQIDPVATTFKWDERISLDGFVERPSWKYRFGFSSDPDAERRSGTIGTGQLDSYTRTRGYTARSGVRLPLGMSVGVGWSYSIGDGTSRQTRDKATVWPDLTFRFGKLDFLLFPKLFARSFTLDSKYSRKDNLSENVATGFKRNQTIADDWSPLLSAGIEWKFAQGLRSTISYTTSKAKKLQFRDGATQDGGLSTDTRDFSSGVSVRTSYSFRGGSNLWLPLFGRMKIQSTLTLDLDVSKRNTRTENQSPNYTNEDKTTSDRSELTIQPSASYNFSTNIKGGLTARWTDTNDARVGNRHVRELQFWVEIRF